jgi:hypothetical protein
MAEARKYGMFSYAVVGRSRRGFPDVVVIVRGRSYFVELKTEHGRLSKLQEVCHAKIREAGGSVVVLYGWEQCEVWLRDTA